MILFETDKRPLTYLLDQVDQGELALPDFQRSFVWDANATREPALSREEQRQAKPAMP